MLNFFYKLIIENRNFIINLFLIFSGEKRVALVPAAVANLCKKGFNINVQDGAGMESQFRNIDYEAAGAKIVDNSGAFK